VVISRDDSAVSSKSITVVIPTRNREELLDRTLNSLLLLEEIVSIIVVDDASNKKVNFAHPKITIIRNNKQLGEGLSINSGVYLVETRYFAVISDDDPQGERWLPEIIKMIERKPGRIAYAPSNIFLQNGTPVRKIIASGFTSKEIHYFDFMPCLAGVVIDLEIVKKEGSLNLRSAHIYPNDFLQWLQLSRLGKIQSVPKSFAYWHLHPQQISATLTQESQAELYLKNVTDWKSKNLHTFVELSLAATFIRYILMKYRNDQPAKISLLTKKRLVQNYISSNELDRTLFFLGLIITSIYLIARKLLTFIHKQILRGYLNLCIK
jgi:glycosyltransferase involved in cell wall biosynthesis